MAEFDWNVLANNAASAANLLRAFEYAEEIFKAISKAEQHLKNVSDEFSEKNLELREVIHQTEVITLQLKTQQEETAKSLQKTKADFDAKRNIDMVNAKAELDSLNKSIESTKSTLAAEQTNLEQTIKTSRKDLTLVETQLAQAKKEYKTFTTILTSNMAKVSET
jgi:myosin heavy subunit